MSSGGSAWACGGFVAPAKADTVGAGDSFLAAFLVELLRGAAPDAALEAACRLGAFVAGRPGATPEHEVADREPEPGWGVDECAGAVELAPRFSLPSVPTNAMLEVREQLFL